MASEIICAALNLPWAQVLLPLMVASIDPLPGPSTSSVAQAARASPAMQDYVAAQVKTVYFLSYLRRQFSEIMRPHQVRD